MSESLIATFVEVTGEKLVAVPFHVSILILE